MSLVEDKVNLIVNINGSAAQNNLNELRKRAADLTYEMKTNLKKGTQEYIDKAAELKKVKSQMDEVKKSIGLAALSIRELAAERAKLTALRNSATPLSKEYKDYDQQLQAVINRQKEVTNGMGGMKNVSVTSFNSIKQNITALAASYIGFYAVVNGMRAVISGAVKLSDQLGDLRRVAGLTKDEANNLNKSLLEIDTRTSGEGLRNIAIIAGKLGVAKGDILSFTEAVDKLVVTLGDELGDADQITTQLGKILNVFDGKVTGDNISRLGNAFVELANAGVASGGFIADFTQRVSGIAKASNLSLGATVGLAAGFEELGLRSESSSTALQKLLSNIAGDVPKAAKIAGVPFKEFNQLFAEKPQEALIKYGEGLVKNKKSFSEITSSFKDAGEEGARVVQTLQAIGQQGDFLREKINLGSDSIERQTSLNEGFAIMNDNLAGSIGRLGKAFDRFVANEKITGFLKGVVNALSDVLDGVGFTINSFRSLDEAIKKDKDLAEFASKIAQDMGTKSIEQQQKIADSYKAIYLNSQKALSNFLKSGNTNIKERNRLLDQQNQDEQIYLATQKELNKTMGAQKNKTDTTTTTTTTDTTAAKSTYDNLIKEAQAFHKKLEELKFAGEQATKSDDQKEIDAVKHKYSEILKEFDALQKKLNRKDQGILGPRADITEAEQKELDALTQKHRKANFEKEQKEAKDIFSQLYADQQQQVTLYYDGLKDKEAKRFADGEIDYKTYQANIAAIDVNSNAALLKNAEDFSAQKVTINGKEVAAVEQAEKDLTAFQKAELANRVNNRLKAAMAMDAERKLLSDLAARAELSQVNTKGIIAGGKGDFKGVNAAEKERAGIILAQRNAALDEEARVAKTKLQEKGEERKRIEKQIDDDIKAQKDEARAEYDQTVIDADNALMQKRIEIAQSFANATLDLFSNINQLINNIEDRKLQKEIDRNNKQKNDLKKSLDNRLISQKQYDKKVAAMDEDIDKRKKELSIKQAKRQKALSVFEAITSTASAVVSALGAKPWGPWNIALAALVGALGLVQVGVISTAPLPEAADGDWFRKGPKHKDPEGGIPVMIERDEAVIKADAMTDKNTYTVTGTPSQITSKLNSLHGGVNWAAGATLQTPKFRERPAQLNPNLPLIMAEGGIAMNSRMESMDYKRLFEEMIIKLDQNNALTESSIIETKNQKDRLHAVVSIKEYRDTEKKYDAAKKASGMSQ